MNNLRYLLSITLLVLVSCASDEEALPERVITDPDEISALLIFSEGTESLVGDIPEPEWFMSEGDHTPELSLMPGQQGSIKANTGARVDGAQVQVAGASTYFNVPVSITGDINTREVASFTVQYPPNVRLAPFDLTFRIYDNEGLAFNSDEGAATFVLTTRIVTEGEVAEEAFATYERRAVQATIDDQRFYARDGGASIGLYNLYQEEDTTHGFEIEGISVQPTYDYESLFLRVYNYKLQDVRPGDEIPSNVIELRYVRYDGSVKYETSQQRNVVMTVDQIEVDTEGDIYRGTFSAELIDPAAGKTFTLTDGFFFIDNNE